MENNRPVYININTMTVVKILSVFVFLYFLYLVREIMAILFVALVLASAFNPMVDWLEDRKIPRAVSILFIYFLGFGIITTAVVLITPPIAAETSELAKNLPALFEKLASSLEAFRDYTNQYGILDNVKESLNSFSSSFNYTTKGVFTTVQGIISGIFSFVLTLVITFYMVVEENAMKKIVWSIAPESKQVYIMNLVKRMQNKVGMWLRGQLILSLILGVLIYIGLSILGVKYALVLALIAMIAEFVPYIGPILASIPAVFLALSQSLTLGVMTLILYMIIQWSENNIIVPKIMQKVVGLSPVISIAVLLIGFKIGGVVGAVLGIPVATAVSVLIKDVFDNKFAV